MEDLKKDIYSTIGFTFYAFLTGKPYTVETLRNYILILNGMQLQGQIESNLYDYYLDVLEQTISFLEP